MVGNRQTRVKFYPPRTLFKNRPYARLAPCTTVTHSAKILQGSLAPCALQACKPCTLQAPKALFFFFLGGGSILPWDKLKICFEIPNVWVIWTLSASLYCVYLKTSEIYGHLNLHHLFIFFKLKKKVDLSNQKNIWPLEICEIMKKKTVQNINLCRLN